MGKGIGCHASHQGVSRCLVKSESGEFIVTADGAEVGCTLALKRDTNITKSPKAGVPEASLKRTDVLQKLSKRFRC